MRRNLLLETLLECLQVADANVGNGPIIEVGFNPVQKLIALARDCFCAFSRVRFYRPNKQVDEMFAPLVNQSRYGPVIEIIKAPANQRETFARKVRHRGREIELGIK